MEIMVKRLRRFLSFFSGNRLSSQTPLLKAGTDQGDSEDQPEQDANPSLTWQLKISLLNSALKN